MPRMPDFIIAGAMKSGTSTLHALLNQHPDIYIPPYEIHFYNMDNIYEHNNFFIRLQNFWLFPDFENDYKNLYNWYCSHFAKASEKQCIGEDSTTYLTSYRALRRIYDNKPDTKIIILLRNPADRAYSHYWHNLRKGRSFWSFDKSIQLEPFTYLNRSMYKTQIDNLLNIFPSSNIMFILYEEFINNLKQYLLDTLLFLGVNTVSYPFNVLDSQSYHNFSRIPKFIKMETYWNRYMYPRYYKFQNISNTPLFLDGNRLLKKRYKALHRIYRMINPLTKKRPPPMPASTRLFLNNLFEIENSGLDELINKDLSKYWYT